jgi:hypothetical protein
MTRIVLLVTLVLAVAGCKKSGEIISEDFAYLKIHAQ